jgi:DNA-directed RNA polymerase alpha subunit
MKYRFHVTDLPFSGRALNVFDAAKIKYVSELIQYTEKDLLRYANCGKVCIKEIKDVLSNVGLSLKEHDLKNKILKKIEEVNKILKDINDLMKYDNIS